MHVKKGDTVLVIAGNDKGKTGTVRTALPGKDHVIVEGVNLRWHHRRPTQQSPKGERLQREVSIHASNVKCVEPSGDAKGKAGKKNKKASE